MYKKYISKSTIVSIFYFIIFIALLIVFYKNPFLQIVTILLAVYLHKILIILIAQRQFMPVLIKELNAPKFNEAINSKGFVAPVIYRISAALTLGDYQTVVNIADVKLKKEKLSIQNKVIYLSALAKAYFELRDFDKVKELCSKYNELKGSYPKKSYFKSKYSLWNYFDSFLANDYEACKTLCKKAISTSNSKKTNYGKLQNGFYYAVACYENGEMEEAKKAFENIIAFAPNMYLANVSQKYIEGIEANSQIVMSETEVLPEQDYKLFDDAGLAKIRRNKIIMRILLILCIFLFAISFFINNAERGGNSDLLSYEARLNKSISSYYDDAEAVTSFTLKTDANVHIDDICLINSGGVLDLVSVVTRDGGDTFGLEKLVTNIALDVPYCVYSHITNYYIGFQIYTDKSWDTDCYNVVEFEYNGQTCWLCVDYIGAAPRISASD